MRTLALLLSLAVLALPSPAADPELTADEIVHRHIEALGGADKLAALRTLKKTGTYVYNGMEHGLSSYHKADRKCREEIEGLKIWGRAVWEGHTVVRGTNGTVAWAVDESREQEMRSISRANAASIIEEADLHGALFDHEKKGHMLQLAGRGDVDGTPAWVLEVTLASGTVQKWFFDEESFLVLRKEVVSEKAEGESPFAAYERPRSWYFDDYRPVGGVMVPFWVYVEEPIFAREYTFETIEANVPLEDSLFEPPPGSYQGRP
jgi:hypothetical protein